MAARYPDVTWLEVDIKEEWPYAALARFEKLTYLSMASVSENIPNLATQWRQLETLFISGHNFAHGFHMRHSSLRTLSIWDTFRVASLTLDCPSLECLTLESYLSQFETPLRLTFESLKELKLVNTPFNPLQVICPKLRKVELRWKGSEVGVSNLEVECPLVTMFQISGDHAETKSSCMAPCIA